MKGEKELWDEIRKRYPELKTDDEIADEVLAHYSGKRGAERLREEQRKIAHGEGSVFDKAKAISALERVRQAINNFWHQVADFLHIHYTSAEQVADQAMKDLLEGVAPTEFGTDSRVREMGSRTNKRMAEIGAHYEGKTLTDEEQAVVDVFSGKKDRQSVDITNADGTSVHLEMQQGNEPNAGTKHSIFRHVGKDNGSISYDEIKLIPNIVKTGTRTDKGANVVYRKEIDGVRYTVYTDKKSNKEIFHDFYSNRKTAESESLSGVSTNTQSSARTSDNAVDAANVVTTSDISKFVPTSNEQNGIRYSLRNGNFKKWFGDWENDPENASKVVDENGEPLVVYHGSGEKAFNTFTQGDIGFHFGNYNQALQRNYMKVDHEGVIRKFYLNIKNPLTIEGDAGNWHGNKLAQYLLSDNSTTDFGLERKGGKYVNPFTDEADIETLENIAAMKDTDASDKRMCEFIEAKGYDGIRYANEVEVSPDGADNVYSYIAFHPNQIKSATDNVGTYDKRNDNILFRTSDELNDEYGDRWLTEQTNNDGRHSTQVKNTVNSYKKFGAWVKEDAKGRNVSVLDASSGLGLGTEALRNEGFAIDDVEPYPSSERPAPTFTNYADIDKQYDYVISNAVLNVIPSDWRANVLHDMADKLKVGGKMVINVRGAESIRKQGKEGVTRITLDDPSEILVLRPDGSIKAYQKGFTKQELKDWCEKELGEGYSVEIATKKNAGDSYDTAVVVTKNNGSDTIGVASEASHPRGSAQAQTYSSANVNNKSNIVNDLNGISEQLRTHEKLGNHEFLYQLAKAFGFDGDNLNHSFYRDLSGNVGIRIATHYANSDNFIKIGGDQTDKENYGVVVKLSSNPFHDNENVDYLEYVYFPDKLNGRRQADIVNGLKHFVQTGDFSQLPHPDKVNPSGKFKVELRRNGTPELVDNGYLPEWQRAARDTPQFMIEASKWANENLGGGHRNRRGWIENNTGITFNPSILWHGLSGYGGGLLTFGMKAYNLGDNIFFGGEHEAKDLPFVGKFYVYSGDCPRSAFFLAFEKRSKLPQAETEFIARHGTIVYGKEPLTLVHPMLELRRLGRRSGQNGPTLAYA